MKHIQSLTKLCSNAEQVWKLLHGVFVVYKPGGEHILQLQSTLKYHLCRDLNNLKVRPPSDYVWIEGKTNERMTVAVGPSYADHPLLVGPRYDTEDIKMSWGNNMYPDFSGVLVIGINNGSSKIQKIKRTKPIKHYRVKGILGKATDNFFTTGKVVEKSTWSHVRREHIDKICASMQSSHQRKMFDVSGVHIQSQAAYELAVKGPIRPVNDKIPMVYSIKCIDFKPPEFTLEIVCINDDDMYLKGLIHELGMQLRSTASCSQIHCTRFGLFTLEHALLKKHWNLDAITHNMALCENIIQENTFLEKQYNATLKEYSKMKQLESPEEQRRITV